MEKPGASSTMERTLRLLQSKIGYYKAAAIAQKAYQENKTLREAAIESGYVTAEEFDRWVDPSKMVGKIE